MTLNFRKGQSSSDDTGFHTEDAIKSIQNGEPINETTLDRAARNVMYRSEEIRQEVDWHSRILNSDRGMLLASESDALLIFKEDGDGYYFVAGVHASETSIRDLYVIPLVSRAGDPAGTPLTSLRAQLRFTQASPAGVFTLTSTKDVFEGGNNIQFRMYESTGLSVSIEGADNTTDPSDELVVAPVCIAVGLPVAGSTIQDIVDAINASSGASAIVSAFVESGATEIVTAPTDWDIPRWIYGPSTDPDVDNTMAFGSFAGIDAEGYRIPQSTLNDIFVSQTWRLQEGDTLAIKFSSVQARMSRRITNAVLSSDLCILGPRDSVYETAEVASGAVVPICKVFNSQLFFADGTVIHAVNDEVTIGGGSVGGGGGGGSTEDTIAAIQKGSAPRMMLSSGTVKSQLTEVATKLASQSGSPGDSMIGADAKTHGSTTLTQGTVSSQLLELTELVDDLGGGVTEESISTIQKGSGSRMTLAAGSVKSQLTAVATQLADQGATTPGDAQIGAYQKSHGSTIVPTGSVSSQLQKLTDLVDGLTGASVDDEHVSTTSGTRTYDEMTVTGANVALQLLDIVTQVGSHQVSTSGDRHVGADAKTGSPYSLTQGSVRSQLIQLLADVNAVAGGVTGGYVVVSSMAALQTAINTAASGGTSLILVTQGVYTGVALTIPAMSGRIYIKGSGNNTSSGPTVTLTGGTSPVVYKNTATGGEVIFENIKFIGTSSSNPIIKILTPVSTADPIQFHNCHFELANSNAILCAGQEIIARDCKFYRLSKLSGSATALVPGEPGFTYKTIFTVENCMFESLVSILSEGNAASGTIVRFKNNIIRKCGVSSVGSTTNLIFSTNTIRVEISGNTWTEKDSAADTGVFLAGSYTGYCNNNKLGCGPGYTGVSYYIIRNSNDTTDWEVSGNDITPGYVGGISGSGVVSNNRIIDYQASNTSYYAISHSTSFGGIVSGNHIKIQAAGAYIGIRAAGKCAITGNVIRSVTGHTGSGIYIGGDYASVSGNSLYGVVCGVKIQGSGCACTGNTIYLDASNSGMHSMGIEVASYPVLNGYPHNNISGNSIYLNTTAPSKIGYGVFCGSEKCVIGNNYFYMYDPTNKVVGVYIYVNNGTGNCYCTVTGNNMEVSSPGCYGVESSNDSICVAGNMLAGCDHNLTGSSVGIGVVGGSFSLTHNWLTYTP